MSVIAPEFDAESLRAMDEAGLISLLNMHEDRVPRVVFDECVRRGLPMVAALDAWLADESRGRDGIGDDEWWVRLHAAFIYGAVPGREAGEALVRFMRRLGDEDDINAQDWLAGYWPALFRNKSAEVMEGLRAIAHDRTVPWYLRANAIDPVLDEARRGGADDLDRVLDWAAGITADESEDWDMRVMTGNNLLDFPRERYRPLLEGLAELQSGTFGVSFDMDDVRRAYGDMHDQPDWERREDPWEFYSPESIAARQARWEREDARNEEEDLDGPVAGESYPEPVETYFREGPKIGRNDPCPCGSGRKYKKCCLRGQANPETPS